MKNKVLEKQTHTPTLHSQNTVFVSLLQSGGNRVPFFQKFPTPGPNYRGPFIIQNSSTWELQKISNNGYRNRSLSSGASPNQSSIVYHLLLNEVVIDVKVVIGHWCGPRWSLHNYGVELASTGCVLSIPPETIMKEAQSSG